MVLKESGFNLSVAASGMCARCLRCHPPEFESEPDGQSSVSVAFVTMNNAHLSTFHRQTRVYHVQVAVGSLTRLDWPWSCYGVCI